MLHNISKVNIHWFVMKLEIGGYLSMALKDTTKHLRELLSQITHDLEKAENLNKAASQRVRTGTVKLEKIAKLYRKESIKNDKSTKGTKKPAKKTATKSKTKTGQGHSHSNASHSSHSSHTSQSSHGSHGSHGQTTKASGTKSHSAKTSAAKSSAKTHAKTQPAKKAPAKKVAAKPKAKAHKATAKPRALSFKRSSAKLPTRRAAR
jgi:Histone H1-like protein Hc1